MFTGEALTLVLHCQPDVILLRGAVRRSLQMEKALSKPLISQLKRDLLWKTDESDVLLFNSVYNVESELSSKSVAHVAKMVAKALYNYRSLYLISIMMDILYMHVIVGLKY